MQNNRCVLCYNKLFVYLPVIDCHYSAAMLISLGICILSLWVVTTVNLFFSFTLLFGLPAISYRITLLHCIV